MVVPAEPAELAKLTAAAHQGLRLPEIIRAQLRAQTGVPPQPVPARVGEPSPIKHVVLIVKENKKFDQLSGDAVTAKGAGWKDYYEAWAKHAAGPGFTNSYQIETLRRYSDKRFPGWQMAIPDQLRADVFLTALSGFEKAGAMPEFTIIYLPNEAA